MDDCTKAIEISTNEVEPSYNRAFEYMDLGEYDKTVNEIMKITATAEAYAKRGHIYSQLGNSQGAIHDYEKSLEFDPKNEEAKLLKDELERLKSGKSVIMDKQID